MLSEKSQAWEDKHHMISLVHGILKVKLTEADSRMTDTRAWRRGSNGDILFKEYQVSDR